MLSHSYAFLGIHWLFVAVGKHCECRQIELAMSIGLTVLLMLAMYLKLRQLEK